MFDEQPYFEHYECADLHRWGQAEDRWQEYHEPECEEDDFDLCEYERYQNIPLSDHLTFLHILMPSAEVK